MGYLIAYLIVTAVIFGFNYFKMVENKKIFQNPHHAYGCLMKHVTERIYQKADTMKRYYYTDSHLEEQKENASHEMIRYRNNALKSPLWVLFPLYLTKIVIQNFNEVETGAVEYESKKIREAVRKEKQEAIKRFKQELKA